MSVSPIFTPNADLAGFPPDMVISSTDSTMFYVHRSVLSATSVNGFNTIFPAEQYTSFVYVAENAAVVTVMLCVIYRLSIRDCDESFETLARAMYVLQQYGVPPVVYLLPGTELLDAVVTGARLNPIEGYILAADLDVNSLGVAICWRYLRSTHLADINDETTLRIGPIYMKRLAVLLDERMDQLKSLVFVLPEFHEASPYCYTLGQGKLTRIWSLGVAQLAWEARPDMSGPMIRSILGGAQGQLTCATCHERMATRINSIVQAWEAPPSIFI